MAEALDSEGRVQIHAPQSQQVTDLAGELRPGRLVLTHLERNLGKHYDTRFSAQLSASLDGPELGELQAEALRDVGALRCGRRNPDIEIPSLLSASNRPGDLHVQVEYFALQVDRRDGLSRDEIGQGASASGEVEMDSLELTCRGELDLLGLALAGDGEVLETRGLAATGREMVKAKGQVLDLQVAKLEAQTAAVRFIARGALC